VTVTPIPVLWFDSRGCGPDEFRIQLHDFPPDALAGGEPHLGIRVRAGGLVIGAAAMVDGGFYLGREQSADLHRQLGEWLEKNP
jgi:hypothetical protein